MDEQLADVARRIGQLTFDTGAKHAPARAPDFRRVVLATDGSAGAEHAVAWARALAHGGAAWLGVITVVPRPMPGQELVPGGERWQQEAEEDAPGIAQRAAAAMPRGPRVETAVARGRPAAEVAAYAEAHDADLIIVGSLGLGAVERAMLGSTADGLLRRAGRSVLIARSHPPPRHILVAVDGSEASRVAAAAGLRLAREWKVPAAALHVLEPPWRPADGPGPRMRAALAAVPPAASADPAVEFAWDVGNPARCILANAQERGSDLVVLGAFGQGGLRRLLGGVGHRVAHDSPGSVLVVWPP